MYKLLRYLRKFPYRKHAKQFEPFDFGGKGIKEESFVNYLIFKTRFMEDWRDTLKRAPRFFGLMINVSRSGYQRAQRRNIDIDLIIAGCREKGFLESKEKNSNLKITSKGWRFSGFWKGSFLSECMREYSLAQLFIAGIIGGIPFGAILLWLVQQL